MEPAQNTNPQSEPERAKASENGQVPVPKGSAQISYEEFSKVEIRVGKIINAEKIPDTDKLLRLMVDFGLKTGGSAETEPDVRQIVSGIALYFPDPASLVGKRCMFVTNLEPRKIRGYESNGMIFAVSSGSAFSLLEVSETIPLGTKAK